MIYLIADHFFHVLDSSGGKGITAQRRLGELI